jgi:pimeloyl-ACP methyl ester carboxylesterase
MKIVLTALVLASTCSTLLAGEPRLQGFDYPLPVKMFPLTSQQAGLEMAYMDAPPKAATNRGTVVLFHGKNFSGAYWGETAAALRAEGYRVVIPDQVGFGMSSKPAHYQFTFQQLAANTRELLRQAGVEQFHLVGHSMGGMLATRYALMFPQEVRSLVLVNPIGLEDWQSRGVPYQTVDQAYRQESVQTIEKIRAYQTENYFHGEWKPEYERWVQMLARFLRDPDYPRMAWNQALTTDMILTQPVCYEFSRLQPPVLLVIGQLDRTALGKDRASESDRARLGNYPALGRQAAEVIPKAKLLELQGVGHAPKLEAFPRFISPLKEFLESQPAQRE